MAIVDNVARYSHRRRIIEGLVADQQPRLVGLTTTFLLSEREVQDTVALIRSLAPEAKIVLGGPTVRRRVALHGLADSRTRGLADYAIFGSGEQAIVQLLGALDGNEDAEQITGLAIRNADGSVTYGKASRELARVDRSGEAFRTRDDELIPIPDWS
ncbi:MAG: radical SAM superfamily enzyme YgiQ (UPF0313 family), partial [Pseudohongiellaceae bacterium]